LAVVVMCKGSGAIGTSSECFVTGADERVLNSNCRCWMEGWIEALLNWLARVVAVECLRLILGSNMDGLEDVEDWKESWDLLKSIFLLLIGSDSIFPDESDLSGYGKRLGLESNSGSWY
jgi:hypothetical protein